MVVLPLFCQMRNVDAAYYSAGVANPAISGWLHLLGTTDTQGLRPRRVAIFTGNRAHQVEVHRIVLLLVRLWLPTISTFMFAAVNDSLLAEVLT